MSRLSIAFRSLSIIVFLFLIATPRSYSDPEGSRPAGSPAIAEFDVVSLRLAGIIFMTASGDMNGDGETDLLLFNKPTKEAYEKNCQIYFQDGGKFPAEPGAEIALGTGVSAISVQDIDSDGTDELCGFDDRGMILFQKGALSAFESHRVIECRTLLPKMSRRLFSANWGADVDSDGRVDVLLPVPAGMRLFVRKETDTFVEVLTLETPMKASVRGSEGQNYVSYRLPEIAFSDFNNDGKTDIGAFDFERMDFFLTNDSKLPGVHLTAPLVREFTKDFIAASKFSDLNADGLPDAVLVLMSQKKNLQSEVRIYFGRDDFSYGDEPSHVFSGDARLILPMFLDATGDGKKELLLQDINVGVRFFLNYFLANRIRVDTELRRLTSDRQYGKRPEINRAIYVRVSESGAEPAHGIGDFNGDGLQDLAVGTNENRMSFFLSNEKTLLPKQPDFEVAVPAYGKMSVLDLNCDDRADIIILYSEKANEGLATLLLSK